MAQLIKFKLPPVFLFAFCLALACCQPKKEDPAPDSNKPDESKPILDPALYGWETIAKIKNRSSTGIDAFASMNTMAMDVSGQRIAILYNETYNLQQGPITNRYRGVFTMGINDTVAVTPLKYGKQGNTGTSSYEYKYGFIPGTEVYYQSYSKSTSSGGFSNFETAYRYETSRFLYSKTGVNWSFPAMEVLADSSGIGAYGRVGSGFNGAYSTSMALIRYPGFNPTVAMYVRDVLRPNTLVQDMVIFRTTRPSYKVNMADLREDGTLNLLDTTRAGGIKVVFSQAEPEYTDGKLKAFSFDDRAIVVFEGRTDKKITVWSYTPGSTRFEKLYDRVTPVDGRGGLDGFTAEADGTLYRVEATLDDNTGVSQTRIVKYTSAGATKLGKDIPFVTYQLSKPFISGQYLYATVSPVIYSANKVFRMDVIRMEKQ